MNRSAALREVVDKEPVYLYGDGNILKRNLDFLMDNYHICGIIDRKYEEDTVSTNKEFADLFARYKPSELNNLDKETKVIITCVYVTEIKEYLTKLGFSKIEHIFSLREDEHSHFHKYDYNVELYYEQVKSLLCDDESKYLYTTILSFRKSGAYDYREICSVEPQYFPQSVYSIGSNEVMVDAGAFTGDTIEAFKKVTGDKFSGIYAFEADRNNFNILKEHTLYDGRIHCYPYAVWNCEKNLRFTENGDSGRISDDDESTIVKACTLDGIIDPTSPVTLIKMDIEGAELKALQGAVNIIEKYHPKLAICIYHKANDIWEIPLYIHEAFPWYKLAIRHHGSRWMETVLYAY